MERKSLSNLPESGDDFWENAEQIKKEIKHTKCEHAFEYVAANQAECVKCHTGYTLGLGWYVKNKKIYFNETLVI